VAGPNSAHHIQIKSKHNPKIGKAKEELFRSAFSRIDNSISRGFHLEAITITESLICDRLETLISVVTENRIKAMNLGPLLKIVRQLPEFPPELADEIDDWRIDRNYVVHQMVKITTEEVFDWRSRMKFVRITAIRGQSLIKDVHATTNRIKRAQKKRKK
jgi:hypothetical protein